MGADTFTYSITDGEGGTDLATATVVFPGVNYAPDADDADDDSKTTCTTPTDPVSRVVQCD